MNSVNVTNTTPTIMVSSESINFHNKKVRYKMDYILLLFILVIILLFIIAFIFYHHKNWVKQKHVDTLTIHKWRIMNFKRLVLEIVGVIFLKT